MNGAPLDIGPGPDRLYTIVEVKNATLTFVLRTHQSDPEPDLNAAIWQVSRISKTGIKTITEYAANGAFNQVGANRESLFPAVQFANVYSLQFDGVNDYVTVPHSASINFANTDGFSLSFWLKTGAAGTTQTFLQKASTATGNNGYTLEMDGSNRLVFQFRGVGTGDRIQIRIDAPSPAIRDGAWHHVCVTKASGSAAASTVKIYIDGVLQTNNVLNDTLVGATTSTGILAIGATITGGTPRFQGNLDEASIWNAELTPAEVTEVYNGGIPIGLSAGSGQIASALVSWWRMGDADVFPTLTDNEDANHATMVNMTAGDFESEVPG